VSHPAQDLLLAFASGSADLPHRVMLEAHLDGCSECRAAVATITSPGAALLRALPAEAPEPALWESLRARIGRLAEDRSTGGGANEVPPDLAGLPLPPAALAELPDLRPLRWHWAFSRGARYATLVRDPLTHSALLIGCLPAGHAFPSHLHLGPEDVQLLAGGYGDEMGHYEAGEYAAYEPGTIHRPVAEAGRPCWTLLRLEQPNRILGWQGWVQRLVGKIKRGTEARQPAGTSG
jgi:putative transcriptional regulator